MAEHNDTIVEESLKSDGDGYASATPGQGGSKDNMLQIRMKGGYDWEKAKINAAREARVKLN